MAIDGIVFDLDGTLVDTNAVHVEAWPGVRAARLQRRPDRIFVEVGKGGDNLVPAILGGSSTRDGDAIRAAHPRRTRSWRASAG